MGKPHKAKRTAPHETSPQGTQEEQVNVPQFKKLANVSIQVRRGNGDWLLWRSIGGDAVHHPAKFGFAKCLLPLSDPDSRIELRPNMVYI